MSGRRAAAGWSMAGRLAARLTLGLCLVYLAAVVAASLAVREEVDEVFDSALEETAQRIVTLAADDLEDRDHDGHGGRGARGVLEDRVAFPQHEEYLIYQVRAADGRILLRSHDAPEAPLTPVPVPGFEDRGGHRVFTAASRDGRLLAQVSEPAAHRAEAIEEAMVGLALPLLALLPLAGAVVWLTVRQAVRPLDEVRVQLHRRGGADLAPLDAAGLPRELDEIVADVNRLMARLGRTLDAERSFTANSAHEMRTPVAAALGQAQLLVSTLPEGDERERARKVAAALDGVGRMTDKLLQLARAEGGAAPAAEPVDLARVLEVVVDGYARSGRHAGRVALALPGSGRPVALGDVDAIGIAVQNLIENALIHGGPACRVAVRLDGDGTIRVTDDGAGVPPDRIALLTERFERLDTRRPGSGLGLSIVDALVARMGGRLVLRSPPEGRPQGFEADITLPTA